MMGAVIADGTSMAGAFNNYPSASPNAIRVYEASYGCLGLARASQISGDMSYVDAVWTYLNWYTANMDSNGFGYDWNKSGGVWSQNSPGYDSTDAYAAMFLVAVRAAFLVTGDRTKLAALHSAITLAVSAIRSTQQTSGPAEGLTWAEASYTAALLEDECEVYCGLGAAVFLADQLGDSTLATNAATYLSALVTGMNTMWNAGSNDYDWAANSSRSLPDGDWANLSPDTMEEGWVGAYRLAARTSRCYCRRSPRTSRTGICPADNAYNFDVTPMGWGFYDAGQVAAAQTQAANIRAAAIATSRAWPFSFQDCGSLIILETNGEALVLGGNGELGAVASLDAADTSTVALTAAITASAAVAGTNTEAVWLHRRLGTKQRRWLPRTPKRSHSPLRFSLPQLSPGRVQPPSWRSPERSPPRPPWLRPTPKPLR